MFLPNILRIARACCYIADIVVLISGRQGMKMSGYEYQVCQVQNAAVTFVNGAWQGDVPTAQLKGPDEISDHCPRVWDYLNMAGKQGWELVAVTTEEFEHGRLEVLYLKRSVE